MPRSKAGLSVIDKSLTARFSARLEELWRRARLTPEGKLGLAVSGGPDSLALLVLAHAAIPDRVEAATVDHGLRAEAADEAAMVAGVCSSIGVPHEVLTVTIYPGNIQSNARAARYGALADWCERRELAAIATAHHADDQAETLLMRLGRGSGVSGLAGVREVGSMPDATVPLLRPLLDWRRAELAAVVAEAGLNPAEDPSNADPRFDRVRMRQALASADWIDIPAVAQSAAHLADADAALGWAAGREWQECVTVVPMGLSYRPQAPRAIALKVIARIVTELGGEVPRGSAVARVFDALLKGQPASIGELVARAGPGGWSFTKAPARRSG